MKKSLFFYLMLTALLTTFSCGNGKGKEKKAEKKNVKVEEHADGKDIRKDYYLLPPLDNNILRDIYDSSDYLDVIFEDLDFSMSLSDNKSIRGFLNYINFKMSPHIKPGCKPMGHFVFVKKGTTVIEGDFYHSPGCYYFLFQDSDGKNIYANAMSDEGVAFFNNIKRRNFKPARK